MSGTRFYTCWENMIKRCYKKNNDNYSRYGGKGIKVCDEWRNSFQNFYDDMKETYSDLKTLDRINPLGDYCKGNCRWLTPKEQGRNRRDNVIIETPWGKMSIAEASERSGICDEVIRVRSKKNLPMQEVFKPTKRMLAIAK